jgi:trimethylamine---corrinoid protein Co-methyltransferase
MIDTRLMNRPSGRCGRSSSGDRMGPAECHRIHQATLEILERVGVDVHDPQARDILAGAGAGVDGIRVRLPEHMVEAALRTAPRRMTLYDRLGRVAVRACAYNTYYGGGSDCLNILDHRTGKRRPPLLSDVVAAVKVMDALSEIDFIMSMVLPTDVDRQIYDRYQMEVMLNHTTKPIIFVTPDFEGCMAAVEVCEAVAGGAEALRRKPFAACYINVTSGLVANEEALRKCVYLAEKGLPMTYIPLNAGGVNSPGTTAGCMATMNAGTLLGIVLSQLVRPGTPVAVPGWNGGPYNLKTMVGNYVLADEQGVPTAMGKYYELPVFGLGGATDAKCLDHQSGFEVTLSLMTALLHGANIVHDVGFMDSGLQASLQIQVMATDFIGFIRAATRRVEVSEETLALDVVAELGPTGNYLGHPHTLRHLREPFYAQLMDKGGYAQWEKRGGKSMEDLAADKIDHILATHSVETPLSDEVQSTIKEIVKREQAWSDRK